MTIDKLVHMLRMYKKKSSVTAFCDGRRFIIEGLERSPDDDQGVVLVLTEVIHA